MCMRLNFVKKNRAGAFRTRALRAPYSTFLYRKTAQSFTNCYRLYARMCSMIRVIWKEFGGSRIRADSLQSTVARSATGRFAPIVRAGWRAYYPSLSARALHPLDP
jgi:hypothetical protein